MAAPAVDAPVTVRRIPDPGEPIPRLSTPGAALFAAGLLLWLGPAALALSGAIPLWLSVGPQAVAAYLLFTVAHDASHRSLSSSERVNVWLGRISIFLFAPQAGFRTWRFIHMQHHRFTNHDDGRDPDHYTHRGPRWQMPLRWLTIDLFYVVWYLPHVRSRPRGEQVELGITWLGMLAIAVTAIATGHLLEWVVLYLLPMRIAVAWLGFAFDYLPHNGLRVTPQEDRYRTARNRVGLERLLTPLLIYQNYHLVHHLHPVIPFHRYLAVWRRNQAAYLEAGSELSDPRGRPITAEEYRALSAAAGHGEH